MLTQQNVPKCFSPLYFSTYPAFVWAADPGTNRVFNIISKSNTEPWLSMAPRCEALLDITQDRKVLAAAQTHPILCKYLLSTLTFSLYTFKRHIIVTTRENIVNVNGSAMEADYGWLGAKQQFWLTYLLSLHIKTLWLLLISNHEWLLIGWSTFAQNFPDCFLQFYDIILLASHRKRIQFQHSTQFHCFIGADGNNGILILNLNWIL